MLEAVGFPVAVNPETRLAAVARKRGWLVEHWSRSPGAPHRSVPIGDRFAEGARHRSTFAVWTDRARRRVAEVRGTQSREAKR